MDSKIKINEDGTVDVDEVLNRFNIFGRYHLFLNVIITILIICTKFSSTSFVVIAAPVKYSCKSDENATCSSFNDTHLCSEWIYEDTNSIISEFNLACQEWKRTLIGTIHSFGYMLGLNLIGPLSDRLGRKKTLGLTLLSAGVVGLAKSFSYCYWMYVALEFFEAFFGAVFSPIFMLSAEIVSTEKRVTFLCISSLGYPYGGLILTVIAWKFQYWRTYIQLTYAPTLILVFTIFLVDESPRWLLANSRKEEAVAIIQKMANRNKIYIDKDLLCKITYKKQNTTNFTELLRDTLLSRILLKRFLVCLVWWIASVFVSNGMTINAVSLEGNKYVNLAILFSIEIPGVFISMAVLNKFKRKHTLITYFFVGAALCLAQPFVPSSISWLSIALYMAGKMMASFYIDLTYLFTSELFPTYTRNSIHALCSSIGRLGSILAPQTPLLMVYWHGFPAFVFGSTALIAGCLTFLVPDTSNASLPDTVEQAEQIGRKKKAEIISCSVVDASYKYYSNETLHTDVNVSQRNSSCL